MSIEDDYNENIIKNIQISSQENILLKSLENFYKNNSYAKNIIPIVRGESIISMRLIDYFVTNYAKNNHINYNIKENNSIVLFNVYSGYKSQLKAFNKKYFDPFSRGNRIPFFFDDDCLITTIGQLNFFKWYIAKDLHSYILANYKIIDINLTKDKNNKKNKPKKKSKKKSKKKKCSEEKAPQIIKNKVVKKLDNIQVSFDI